MSEVTSNIEIFVNFNFKSGSASEERTKIIVCFVDTNDAFGVSLNNKANTSYKFSHNGDFSATKHVQGYRGVFHFAEKCIENYRSFSEENFERFRKCAYNLKSAFRYYLSKSRTSYSFEQQNEIYSKLNQIEVDLKHVNFDSVVCDSNKVYDLVEEIHGDNANDIIENVFKHEGEEICVNGKYYILKDDEKGNKRIYEVKYISDKLEYDSVSLKEEAIVNKKVYKKKDMCLILTDKFVNFNQNELYDVKKHDDKYFYLLDNYGKVRTVKSENVRYFEVYEEIDEEFFEE